MNRLVILLLFLCFARSLSRTQLFSVSLCDSLCDLIKRWEFASQQRFIAILMNLFVICMCFLAYVTSVCMCYRFSPSFLHRSHIQLQLLNVNHWSIFSSIFRPKTINSNNVTYHKIIDIWWGNWFTDWSYHYSAWFRSNAAIEMIFLYCGMTNFNTCASVWVFVRDRPT